MAAGSAAARHAIGAHLKTPATRALAIGIATAGLLGGLHALGVGLPLLFGLAAMVAVLTLAVPTIAAHWMSDLRGVLRARFWAPEQGSFHSFGGVPLEIEDDGRHVWLAGPGLQRVLGQREPEDVQAARHSGRWRRSEKGTLMLRVDAVVEQLASMAGRDDPRVQKLRRYLERDVLYPAEQRRKTHQQTR